MLVKDCRGKIRVGDKIHTNASGSEINNDGHFVGTVKCIHDENFCVLRDGIRGTGCGGSWTISFKNANGVIEVLERDSSLTGESRNNDSMDIRSYIKRIGLSETDKVALDSGIENPVGTPTELGLEIAAHLNYKAHREEILRIALDMAAEEKAKKAKKAE